ncbi:MAG: disulfide bond formation protein B [Bosea sp. (in: a-proteobacteria)]|uniref:disulfide bond formation protein B n=1 Tax=Bosea sp. (in: a-proteobacteria) TaxID=1871050 RepID=UPI003F7C0E24
MTASILDAASSRDKVSSRLRPIAAIGLVSAALIAGAWYFQLVMGLVPCKLCLEQRWPHYAAIAVSVAALALARSARLQWSALLALAILMAWSTGLGVYHSGVEWGWFLGPSDCGGGTAAAAGVQDFMKQLQSVRVVSCGEAAWRFLGLSLAGWNAVVSAGLCLIALFGLVQRVFRTP